MRSTIKFWAVVLGVTMFLGGLALAGYRVLNQHTSNDSLNAVSCLSADSCVAVGSAATVTGETETEAPAAMRWDGSRWHPLAVRLPSGAVQGQLSSVSCQPGGCLAVGNYSPAHVGFAALAEYWDASTWTPVPMALPPGPQRPSLLSVSCVTVRQCIATGSYGKPEDFVSPLAAAWDGREWSWSWPSVRMAGNPGNRILAGVSCVTARYCVAAGNAYDTVNDSIDGFTEVWDGHGWTQAYALVPVEAAGLSCPARGYCVLAGTLSAGDPAGFGQVLVGSHWAKPGIPWPPGTRSYLHGVSCTGRTCVAVGETMPSAAADGYARHPAALTWNGVTWTRQAMPTGTIGTLYGVTCVTAADCVAVGSTQGGGSTIDLSEFWNGTAWTVVKSG